MRKSSSIFQGLPESSGAVERSGVENVNSFRSSRVEERKVDPDVRTGVNRALRERSRDFRKRNTGVS
ncbi:MAG: hypothetical protein DBX53_01760 [Clostridiales bacterium]|nr:MAG: hypothetical protein DBX53_01760 [Clostridiales bacterium]